MIGTPPDSLSFNSSCLFYSSIPVFISIFKARQRDARSSFCGNSLPGEKEVELESAFLEDLQEGAWVQSLGTRIAL
jgi:hypothetical protein